MLRKKDILIAKRRKKLWDIMKWGYKSIMSLSKNHSLNCGCSICRYHTYEKRLQNKRVRHKNKIQLLKELNNQ